MKFLRVNLTDQTLEWDECSETYAGLGGRALTSIMVNNEVEPTTDALGADNKLIFAPGYFAGTPLINTSRLSIGAKSPLTGGIKESNVGGTVAFSLARLGIAAVIIEGQAAEDTCFLLTIADNNAASLLPAGELKGMRTYQLVRQLQQRFGTDISITCTGPGWRCAASLRLNPVYRP